MPVYMHAHGLRGGPEIYTHMEIPCLLTSVGLANNYKARPNPPRPHQLLILPRLKLISAHSVCGLK